MPIKTAFKLGNDPMYLCLLIAIVFVIQGNTACLIIGILVAVFGALFTAFVKNPIVLTLEEKTLRIYNPQRRISYASIDCAEGLSGKLYLFLRNGERVCLDCSRAFRIAKEINERRRHG